MFKKIVQGAFIMALCIGFTSSPQSAVGQSLSLKFDPSVNTPAGANSSYNWAGYMSSGGNYTSIAANWTVPNIQYTSTSSLAADATWIGIGGSNSKDLIQEGTQAIVNNGQISYQAWYELLPSVSATIPVTIHPGDYISASLSEQSSNQWIISFKNNTTNQVYQTYVNYTSSKDSAEWIEEMPTDASNNAFIPLDNFGTLQLVNATTVKNGVTETLTGSQAEPLSMYSQNGTLLASPSSIGTDGMSFSVTRSNAVVNQSVGNGRGYSRRRGSHVSVPLPSSSSQSATSANITTDRNGIPHILIQLLPSSGSYQQIQISPQFSQQFFRIFQKINRGILSFRN